MGRSLELLEGIYADVTEGGQSALTWMGCLLLGSMGPDPQQLLRVEEGDNSLDALRKVEMAHTTPLKDIPGYISPTFEAAIDRLRQLAATGVREGFLVRGIIDNVEEMLRGLADRHQALEGLARQREFAEFMDAQMAQDSPENADRYAMAREHYKASASMFEHTFAVREEDYRRWQEVAGPWLQQPRFMGGWEELERPSR